MKKFITYISRQPKGKLESGIYKAVGNERLQMDSAVHFPVLTMMNGYIEENENVELVIIRDRGNDCAEDNLSVLNDDLEQLKQIKYFEVNQIEVEVSGEEAALDHLKSFMTLLDIIKDGDELYLCCTYGSKPTPIVEMMAVNFAFSIKRDVAINCIVYGLVNHHKTPKEFSVYDITPLFHMTQITNRLAEQGVKNPEVILRHILGLEDLSKETDDNE